MPGTRSKNNDTDTIKDLTNKLEPAAKLDADTTGLNPPNAKNKDAANEVAFDQNAKTSKPKVKKDIPMPTNVEPSKNFAPLDTGKTPRKTKKAIDEGVAPEEIKHRWDTCTGIPLKAYKFTNSGTRISRSCALCKTGTTSWYCLGCKSWFCMTGEENETRKKTFTCTSIKNEEHTFEMSCFHQKHQAAWERAEAKGRVEEAERKIANLEKVKESFMESYNKF